VTIDTLAAAQAVDTLGGRESRSCSHMYAGSHKRALADIALHEHAEYINSASSLEDLLVLDSTKNNTPLIVPKYYQGGIVKPLFFVGGYSDDRISP